MIGRKPSFPRIPDAEFAKRMASVKKKMREQSLDLLVIYSNMLDPGHVRYLADVFGINESAGMVIPLKGNPIVCSGQACQAWSQFKSRVKDVRIFPEVGEVAGTEYMVGDQFSFASLFQDLARASAIKKIGVVGTLIFPQIIHAQLQKTFPKAKIVNAEPLMFELRFVKSQSEIACMKKAADIVSGSFAQAVKKIKPGWTELDIQAEITAEILRSGAESTAAAWEPMIPSGPNSMLCMNRNSLRKVKAGEIVCLQAGAMYEGYNAALCTPLVLGKVPEKIKKAVNAAYDSMEAIVGCLKAGVTSREANAVGKAALANAGGYDKYDPYAMVHSIGMIECESPWMAADKDFVIPERATVCIDVFLFRMPWGSFRIEDTVTVTARGAEVLTTFNQKFLRKYYA